jgi:hypothetical protein
VEVRILRPGEDRFSQSVLVDNYPPLSHNHHMNNDQSRGLLLVPSRGTALFPVKL